MELTEAMRTTGTCRRYLSDPVPDEVFRKAFDVARFGPQGGNRQPVRWIVVREQARKQALADLYLPMWEAYFSGITGGTVAVGALPKTVQDADFFARHLAEVPAIVVVCAAVDGLHPTDHELGRLSVVGGASIYPTVQNLCLTLRDQGVATAVTTLLCAEEPKVRELLEIPEGYITAAHIAVGYPERPFPKKLTRDPVEQIVALETFTQPMFGVAMSPAL
ncbi:nitroreductase family protein [Rhodococcus sp. 1168]|uniref:nitroreductase family protein n=1 Tax=Rhodococcus sp. 1168 TaxID=2018041 RepID=UPI000A09A861|nr:nitroreductase family protein [Rhodococcus sp. 1168]ORI21214.1 oxidoreductase [Rhodococcus sp. 1168]